MNQKQGALGAFKDRWSRHTVAVPKVTRTIDSFMRTMVVDADMRKVKAVRRIEREEMVHMHDVYRQKVDGKVLKTLWHRGANVGVV